MSFLLNPVSFHKLQRLLQQQKLQHNALIESIFAINKNFDGKFMWRSGRKHAHIVIYVWICIWTKIWKSRFVIKEISYLTCSFQMQQATNHQCYSIPSSPFSSLVLLLTYLYKEMNQLVLSKCKRKQPKNPKPITQTQTPYLNKYVQLQKKRKSCSFCLDNRLGKRSISSETEVACCFKSLYR